jgi:uncharacterized membrane protein
MRARMSTSTLIYLLARVLHVLLAAIWVGLLAFVALFLLPALRDTGAAGGSVVTALVRRRLPAVNAMLGGITILTGFWLYWRFTGGFDPALAGSMPARVFGTGGLAGMIALALDGALVGRNLKKLGGAAAPMEIAAARARATTFAIVVLVLQVIAVACMAVAHYI